MRLPSYILAGGLAVLMVLNSVPVVRACGPSEKEPIFVFKESGDPPFDEFANGRIGIVRPTFGRKTMVVAYRYLNGRSFTGDKQKELIDGLKGRAPEDDGTAALKAWINGRKEFLKEEQKLPEIYTERQHGGGYDFFPNCTKNAFEVALETLKDRAATYGAEDPNVKTWLAAQDTVFQNCSRGTQIPRELGAESPSWLRKDRDYQIGAALFYSLNFDDARARFTKIAADNDSPWHELADYLVARTLIRQGSLSEAEPKKRELYEQAEDHLQKLVITGGKFASASGKLLSLVKFYLHPQERVVELGRTLAAGNDENLRQDLIDYAWLIDKLEAKVLQAEEARKKKLAGEETEETNSDNRPEEVKQRQDRLERGEAIDITIYPVKQPDGNPDYSQRVTIEFKHDTPEDEILGAFEQQLGRKLSSDETKQIKELHQSALSYRQWNLSPNRKWDRASFTQYEGCSQSYCSRLTLDLIPEFLRSDDLSEWILTLQTKDPRAYRHALSKWRKTDSPAWLVSALVKAEKTSARLHELIRAGERVTRDEPAFPTIVYHLIRLKIDLGQRIEARKLLDEISSQSADLPLSAQNQFLELRMQLARGLNEFLKAAQRKPVAFYEDGRLGKLSDLREMDKQFWSPEYSDKTKEEHEREVEESYKDLLPWQDRFGFDTKTIEVLNWHFPTQLLAEAARNPNVPDYLKRSLVLAVWTRATLLHNDEIALEVAPEVLKVEPKLTAVFEPYLKARTLKERRNAVLYVFLKFPDLSPFVQGGIPAFTTSEELEYYFGESWWCKLEETDYDEQFNEVPKVVPKPSFLTPAQLETARREHLALAALGDGKSYLGKQVIAWAKASPNDARIPEALFIGAKANESYKYGCNGWDHDEKSKTELESILRRRYPMNAWTAKLGEPEN